MEKKGWIELVGIIVGGSLGLPTLMVGFELANHHGAANAIIAILIGNVVLFGLAIAMVTIAFLHKAPTMAIARAVFGKSTRIIAAVTLVPLMVGWASLQLNILVDMAKHVINSLAGINLGVLILSIIIGLLITFTACGGLQRISNLAFLKCIPVGLTMIYLLVSRFGSGLCLNNIPVQLSHIVAGVPFVIAIIIALVIDLPTFTHTMRTKRDAVIALTLSFLVGIPLLEIMGVVFATAQSASMPLSTLLLSGSFVWQMWITGCSFLGGWLVNMINLFSAAININQAIPRIKLRSATLSAGIVAIIIACSGLTNAIGPACDVMALCTSSMGMVMLGWHIAVQCSCHIRACWAVVAWILGVCMGAAHALSLFSLTNSATFDSGIVSALCMLCVAVATWCLAKIKIPEHGNIV